MTTQMSAPNSYNSTDVFPDPHTTNDKHIKKAQDLEELNKDPLEI